MVSYIKFPLHNYGGEILCPPSSPPVRHMVRVRVRARVRVRVKVSVRARVRVRVRASARVRARVRVRSRFMYFQRPYIKFPLHRV